MNSLGRSSWVFLLGALMGVGALSGCATSSGNGYREISDSEKATRLVQMAQGAIAEKDPTGALTYLLEAEKLAPKMDTLHYAKALAFFQKGNRTEALVSARAAVRLNPANSAANNTVGKLLLDQGKYTEAEAYLLKAAADPTYSDGFMAETNLGILYYRTARLERARTYLDRAIRSKPTVACVAHYYKGNIALQRSRLDEAVRSYEKAVDKFCASFAEAHFALGVAYTRNRHYDKARRKFLEVKSLYPDSKVAAKAMERLKYLP